MVNTVSAGQEARTHTPSASATGSLSMTASSPTTSNPQAKTPLEQIAPGVRDLSTLSCGCRNHRQLKRWLQQYMQQMDSARAPRTAGALRNLLAEIPRWQAPARRRLACLETLRPAILTLSSALSSDQQPQTPEARRGVLIACILFQHLAQSYSAVASELVHSPLSLFHRRTLAGCLQRAMDSYRRLIRLSCASYLATPKQTWVRIQALVQLAHAQQLTTFKVRDHLGERGNALPGLLQRRQAVIAPYLQAALFASANPLQLDNPSQKQLWALCTQWATGARLIPHPTGGGPVLLASLHLDQAPLPLARLQRAKLDMQHFRLPRGWAIDLQAPLAQLDKKLRKPGNLPLDLLQQVHALWAGEKGRDTVRTPVNLRCQVAIGISSVCFQLRQESGGEQATVSTAAASPAFASSGGQKIVMDVGAIDFQTGDKLNDYEATLPAAPGLRSEQEARTRQQQNRYQAIPATLVNLSARGAGLRLPQTTLGKVHSGDLIGLTINDRWQVALVRWQYSLPDHCRVGVELLGGQTSAVRVHRYNRSGQRTEAMPALLTGDQGGVPELILPVPLFQAGDSVDIVSSGHTRNVTLHRAALTTGSFGIFEFS